MKAWVLAISGLVTQGAVAEGSLSGYLPDTVEEACAQMDEADVASCQIMQATDKAPYRIIVTVDSQDFATAYTLAATALGTLSCKTVPTIITVGVGINDTKARSFEMWCSPASPSIKLKRAWRTMDVTQTPK